VLHATLSAAPAVARRAVFALAAAVLVAQAAPAPALAQRAAPAAEIDTTELMKPTDLADIAIGPADAKVTVIEYSSLTCPHCAHFEAQVFPAFRAKYVDTGKVRFITREFPLDNMAAAASMLARCLDPDKSFAFIDNMFATQETWAHGEGPPLTRLFDAAKPAGFTKESFDKCLTDQALYDKIVSIRDRAGKEFGVDATPTFFINGKRLQDAPTIEAFDKAIGEIVKS